MTRKRRNHRDTENTETLREFFHIRPEQPEDALAVRAAVAAAFGRSLEAEIVDALRASGRVTLALVAVLGGEVVGHVAFSPARVESAAGEWGAVALGPLAVAPEHQRQGIGSALVRRGLEACRAMGHGVVFLLGHPTYYPRFGFQPTARFGIACEFPAPDEAFMLIELVPGALNGRRGVMHFAPEFHTTEA